jgi:hypothetical protein
MSKKKAAKLGLTAAVAASAFVAGNPADAAATKADQLVTNAVNAAKQLKPFYGSTSLEVSAEFTAKFNAAKAAVAKAKAAKLNDAQAASVQKAEEEVLRAARYIDAVKVVNNELQPALDELQGYIDDQEIGDEMKAAYDNLSEKIRKAERVIGKVYGAPIREAFLSEFVLPAKIAKETVIYEVSRFNLLNVIDAHIKADELKEAEEKIAMLERLEKRSVEIKEAGNKLHPGKYPELPEIEKALVAKKEAVVKAYEEKLAPAVVSVSAINGKQLVVKFNKPVDKTSAETVANYTLSDNNTVTTASVLEDGKSVKLTLTNAYTTATNVAVTVKDVALKSDVNKTFPLFSTTVKVEDTVKPEITSVEAITNTSTATSATIYFSEPVKEGIVKIDGQSVATITSTVESLPVNGLSLDASKTHKVEIVNLKDTANNVTALATTEFSVKKDADAPTVASVQAYGDYKILVTFNKKINASTVAAADVSVKDELLNNVSVSGFDPLTGDTTGTKFVITLDKTQPEVSGLYTNKDTRNLTIVFADKSIDDTLGNQLAATTRTVTLSKDVTAPSVMGITFEKNATTKQVTKLKVTFDEEISGLDTSKFTIVDANGVLKNSILTGASVSVSGKEATIDITDATLTGSYSFQIASGAATDLALTPNKSKAFTGTVDFGAAETVGSFDFVDGDNDPTNGEVTEANNVITVTFPEAVKGGAVAGSATDVNNYSINGKPLPAGTTITLDSAQKVATITLSDESIAVSDSAAVFTINNVQSLTNKTIKPVTTTVAIVDNVDPVLQSARVLDNNTIELTYSENLGNISGAYVGAEFVIYEGTTAKALNDADVVATRVAGFNNKVVIDLQGANVLDLTKEISVKTVVPASDVDIVDGSGNKQKADVKVVATK